MQALCAQQVPCANNLCRCHPCSNGVLEHSKQDTSKQCWRVSGCGPWFGSGSRSGSFQFPVVARAHINKQILTTAPRLLFLSNKENDIQQDAVLLPRSERRVISTRLLRTNVVGNVAVGEIAKFGASGTARFWPLVYLGELVTSSCSL